MGETNGEFYFLADDPCLDFVNTKIVDNGETVDLLNSMEDVINWYNQSDLLDRSIADSVLENWGFREKREAFEHIMDFRQTLESMAENLSSGEDVEEQHLEAINHWLKRPSLQSILKQTEDGFEHHKRLDTSAPKNLLYPIALSASELLESGEEANVKRCDNPECILYFYDTTKNGSRRWCSMDQCGNRMKAKRYYDRQKSDD
jgi:predicted RNA-binding Zn ribbon-like protein